MTKPSIRKRDGCWQVTRPGYGFNPQPSVDEFESWKAAVASLRAAPGSAGPTVERAAVLSGLGRWWAPRGTIRMEDT